jgi:hypothetical protein
MRRMRESEGRGGKTDIQVVPVIFLVSMIQDKRRFLISSNMIGIAHSYQYTFEPNPSWSAFYAPALEICKYLHGVAEKYGVPRYVKTSHKVTNCIWDDGAKKWYEIVAESLI